MNKIMGAPLSIVVAALCIGSIACAPLSEAGDPIEVGEAVEALSNQEHCGTAPSNAGILHNGSVTSGMKYGSSQCASAYLVDLVRYTHDNAVNPHTTVIWNDALPGNASDCQRAHVMVYVWELTGGMSVYLGARNAPGVWNGFGCAGLLVALDEPPLAPVPTSPTGTAGTSGAPPQRSYRYAVSARQEQSNGYVLHSMFISAE